MPGTGTPLCARCTKPVYFAEQAKAVGKTFHKFCLRCTECNTSLDSTRLAEKEGKVVCRSCYGKVRALFWMVAFLSRGCADVLRLTCV
jgi:predicted nucleic acid-binding Zn ribbon protein